MRRATVVLDDELVKKLYIIQAKMIKKEKKHISFSKVVNLTLRKTLK